jgi:regulator of sirC expression with transglutaminase-like and TPR domain
MANPVSIDAPPSPKQMAALVTLLADDDPAVHRLIRGKLLAYGDAVLPALRPYLVSNDPVVRRRAREIVGHVGRQSADTRFLGFCLRHGEDLDLEKGIWALAQTRYPDLHAEGYQAIIDSHAATLRERVDPSAPPRRLLESVNHYLFEELGFRGNEEDYYDPANSYLNQVCDRRKGNPVSLCMLYLFVARRLQLPVTGIGMPGHFLCRYQSATEELYIDAFNRGKLLTKPDCIKYLMHSSAGLQEGFLAPVTPRRILLRVCSNLHQIYAQLNQSAETAQFQRYIVALAK